MGFFKTNDGSLHTGRAAGMCFALALVPGCESFHLIGRLCVMRIVTTIGWWLAFGVRKRLLKVSELFADPVSVLGMLTVAIGLVLQFYFTGSR